MFEEDDITHTHAAKITFENMHHNQIKLVC